MIRLYVIENYRESYPALSGSELTDALIKDCLQEEGYGDAEIGRAESGKPYVERKSHVQGSPSVYISVSHSGIYFVCAVADKPAGVDLQEGRRVNAERIGRRYFSQSEREYIEAHGEKGFFTIWTRKEAYSKYTGRGLEEIMKGTDILDRADVEFFDFRLEDRLYCSCCIMKGSEE